MRDFWMMGPTAAALQLRAMGFSWMQAERLTSLKMRYDRGDFAESTAELNRLHFYRYLVQSGRYTDQVDLSSWNPDGRQAA